MVLVTTVVGAVAAGWWVLADQAQRAREHDAAEQSRLADAPISPADRERWGEAVVLSLSRIPGAPGFIAFPGNVLQDAKLVPITSVRIDCDPDAPAIALEWGQDCDDCSGGTLSLIGSKRSHLGAGRDDRAGLPVGAPKLEQASVQSRQFQTLLSDACLEIARRLSVVARRR